MSQNETPKTTDVPDDDTDDLQEFADELQDALYRCADKIEESALGKGTKRFLKEQADRLNHKIYERMGNGTITEFALKLFENQVNNFRNRITKQIKAASGGQEIVETRRDPLGEHQIAVYEYLKSLPEYEARTGREILMFLEKEKNIIIDQSTLTKSIMPLLKRSYGVVNKRGKGYYITTNTPH